MLTARSKVYWAGKRKGIDIFGLAKAGLSVAEIIKRFVISLSFSWYTIRGLFPVCLSYMSLRL